MPAGNRPLSPHLQVYRPQLTSVLSFIHRLTGAGLAVGTLLLVYWLVAIASGPETYDTAQDLIGSFIGRLFLFGWSVALFYHLCNGIRHLVWDTGHSLDLEGVYRGGWAVLIGTGVLTLLSWIFAYVAMGAF